MNARSTLNLALSLAIALSMGCQGQVVPTGAKPKPPKPKLSPSASATLAPGTPINKHIPLAEPQRLIDLSTNPVELIGKVKLVSKVKIISDNGASIISDNGASIISNNGGTIISDNGASLIGNNGGSLIGKTKYAIAQAGGTSAVPEALLADAQIEVLDAAGNVLVTPDKKPITAMTDNQGNYSLKTALPNENLILRVRLFNGGQLFAFTTKDKRTGTLDIDTASSLGTAYVMDKYVKKQQAVLDKLPGLEAAKLQADMAAARVHLADEALAMQPSELIEMTERLRAKEPKLEQTIKRIEAILLAGQSNLGNGLKANQVSLSSPIGIVGDSQGNFYIAESSAGRIRKVAPDGTVSVHIGPGAPAPRDGAFGKIREMLGKPDGTLYLINELLNQVTKIAPDGQRTIVAGNGKEEPGPVGSQASLTPLYEPRELALTPEGLLYILEHGDGKSPTRLLYVDAQGVLRQEALPTSPVVETATGFTITPDGTFWLYASYGDSKRFLSRKKPGGAWETVKDVLPYSGTSYLDVGPDNSIFLTSEIRPLVVRVSATGEITPFAGTGKDGYQGDGGAATAAQLNGPKSVWAAPDGKVYLGDNGNGLIRVVKDGTISTFAGVQGLSQVGDALAVAINQPSGLAVDPQGRLVIAEAASHTIKRLDDKVLTRIAGTDSGFSGDGGPATEAQLYSPTAIAYHNGELYIMDSGNARLRKIDTSGNLSTVAGSGLSSAFGTGLKVPALEAKLQQPTNLIVSPEGVPYWTDSEDHMILRLKDGFVERVAGLPGTGDKGGDSGDGGPAVDAKLSAPSGLAFDKAGNLYIADSGNLRIRKVDPQGTISTFAGVPIAQVLPAIFAGTALGKDGDMASKSVLWGPAGLAFDAEGNLFISEAGTVNIGAVSGPGAFETGGGLVNALPENMVPKVYARIRKITPDGKLYNVTGPGTGLLDDTAGDNMLMLPIGLLYDAKEGRLVIGDAGLNQLKVLPKGSF